MAISLDRLHFYIIFLLASQDDAYDAPIEMQIEMVNENEVAVYKND